MSILLSCRCGKKLRVKEELAGKKVKCPGCAAIVPVPAPAAEPPEPPEEEQEEPEPPPPPRSKKEDVSPPEDEEQEARAFWVDPHALGGKIIALAEDGLYVADFNDEKEYKRVKKALAQGEPAEKVLADAETKIPFDIMRKVESNLYHRFIDVKSRVEDAPEDTETTVFCPDQDTRDEIMEALRERLGWKREVIEFSRLKASWPPLVVIGLFGFMTFCFIMVALGHDKGGGGGKVVRTNWIGAIFVWVWNTIGPVGVSLLGGSFVLAGVAWLVARLIHPPIMLTLTPRSGKRSKNRDD